MDAIVWFYLLVLIPLYFIPSIVAVARKRQVAAVVVINFFLGWTILGWVGALALAVSSGAKDGLPPSGYPPNFPPPAGYPGPPIDPSRYPQPPPYPYSPQPPYRAGAPGTPWTPQQPPPGQPWEGGPQPPADPQNPNPPSGPTPSA